MAALDIGRPMDPVALSKKQSPWVDPNVTGGDIALNCEEGVTQSSVALASVHGVGNYS